MNITHIHEVDYSSFWFVRYFTVTLNFLKMMIRGNICRGSIRRWLSRKTVQYAVPKVFSLWEQFIMMDPCLLLQTGKITLLAKHKTDTVPVPMARPARGGSRLFVFLKLFVSITELVDQVAAVQCSFSPVTDPCLQTISYILFKKRAGVYYQLEEKPRVFKPVNVRLHVFWTASKSLI